jgi:hypothetical protein
MTKSFFEKITLDEKMAKVLIEIENKKPNKKLEKIGKKFLSKNKKKIKI